MIEREAAVRVFNESLGAKGTRGRLVRVAPEGFYEVMMEVSGRSHTTLLPVQATVLIAADPEEEIAALEVER